MYRLVKGVKAIGSVNLGGIHHRAGRSEKLRYIYLTPDEEQQLRELEAAGVEVTAQDVPSARAVPLPEVLQGATR
jgi:mannose/fructose/N-acetylgalactosamine-specific phosphotransferase system component IIB